MILGVPDDLPGAAQVINGSTSQITSYATLLESLPVQIWDTPGLDKALDGRYVRDKVNHWLLQVSSSHCEYNWATDHPYLNLPSVQVVWCMHAEEISDPVAWQQFGAIYEECGRQGVIPMVLINQVPTQSPSDWEVQCENQLQQLGGSVLLQSMRSHRGVSSPEYKDGSQALSKLIRQHAVQNLRADITLDRVPFQVRRQYANRRFDLYIRCGWVSESESTCFCIVRRSDLMKHLRLCHGVTNSTVTCRWGGDHCNEIMQRGSVIRHIRLLHLYEGFSVCTVCGKKFSRQNGLYTHMKYSHGL